ncbi:hypothetical protein [Granulibacter bethesdensis]|uniref:hypothetical protein n=1 Tax=Granulibacter bethesdensis TaxID=364410 RepID=UPI000932B84A|nr:hypothetical protein [Granulibacter bethesdensis]
MLSETDNPTTWHEGVQKLSPLNLLCPGFQANEWGEFHTVTKAFLETRASDEANMGRTGIDLSSVRDKIGAPLFS